MTSAKHTCIKMGRTGNILGISIALSVVWMFFSASCALGQDVADRISMEGMLTDESKTKAIRSITSATIRDVTHCELIAVTYSMSNGIQVLAIRSTFVRIPDEEALPGARLKRSGYEFVYSKTGMKKVVTKNATASVVDKLCAEAWALVKNPTIGMHRGNLARSRGLDSGRYLYVFCRDPSRPEDHGRELLGGVIVNPIAQSKCGRFTKRIAQVIANMKRGI